MIEIVYAIACAVLLAGSVYMIFATCYDDGTVGKIGFGILALGAAAAMFQVLINGLRPRPEAVWIAAGSAVFMLRHLVRFWQYRHRATRGACSKVPRPGPWPPAPPSEAT